MTRALSTAEDIQLTILSVDPGTQNLGLTASIADFKNREFEVITSQTIDIDRLVNINNAHLVEVYNKYSVMMDVVYSLIYEAVKQYNPDWVICESPYMNSRFPLPYALLTLCTQTINKAVKDYSTSIGFSLVDPASVKKEIGAKGNSGDKTAVKTAILTHPAIVSNIDLSLLDEHSCDSIAIGYYGFSQYLKDYNLK